MSSATLGPSDAVQAIRALDAEFQRNAVSGDAAALTEAFYADDAVLLPPNAPQVKGKAAIREFWQALMATGPSDLVVNTTTVSASGDLAYGVGQYEYKAEGTKHAGKYVAVYRRQSNGSYRAVVDIFNANE